MSASLLELLSMLKNTKQKSSGDSGSCTPQELKDAVEKIRSGDGKKVLEEVRSGTLPLTFSFQNSRDETVCLSLPYQAAVLDDLVLFRGLMQEAVKRLTGTDRYLITRGIPLVNIFAAKPRLATFLEELLFIAVDHPEFAPMNIGNQEWCPPLHVALMKNNLIGASLLIKYGADVNGRRRHGTTALIDCARDGKLAGVVYLIRKGAILNMADDDGNTALHWAASRNEAACVAYLLQKGAEIEMEDNDGQTPLVIAAVNNQKKTVRLLTSWRKQRRLLQKHPRTK